VPWREPLKAIGDHTTHLADGVVSDARSPADAIIVLGRGVTPQGSLPLPARFRVERAVSLYQIGVAPRLIVTGRWSLMTADPPPITEARAMADLAIGLGVPGDAVFLEEDARDTIGNAYFVARRLLEPNGWRSVRVVTSDFHVPRAAWVFQKVLGDEYDVAFSPSSSELFASTIPHRVREESDVMRFIFEWIGHIDDGDREALDAFIRREHPGYSDRAPTTRAMIQERLEEIARGHRREELAESGDGRGHRTRQERATEL
jgi:uncharacterized SAM-binding protein YcdF (DUF218 family)